MKYLDAVLNSATEMCQMHVFPFVPPCVAIYHLPPAYGPHGTAKRNTTMQETTLLLLQYYLV